MTEPRQRRRAERPAGPPAPATHTGEPGCRCRPSRGEMTRTEQRWPLTYAVHHGEARYTITRVHRGVCGLPAEPLDPSTYGRPR